MLRSEGADLVTTKKKKKNLTPGNTQGNTRLMWIRKLFTDCNWKKKFACNERPLVTLVMKFGVRNISSTKNIIVSVRIIIFLLATFRQLWKTELDRTNQPCLWCMLPSSLWYTLRLWLDHLICPPITSLLHEFLKKCTVLINTKMGYTVTSYCRNSLLNSM